MRRAINGTPMCSLGLRSLGLFVFVLYPAVYQGYLSSTHSGTGQTALGTLVRAHYAAAFFRWQILGEVIPNTALVYERFVAGLEVVLGLILATMLATMPLRGIAGLSNLLLSFRWSYRCRWSR